MKKLYLRAAVGSAMLILSGLANANNINFTNAADAIIDAELQPFIISYSNDPNSNWGNFIPDILTQLPAYSVSNGGSGDMMDGGLKRVVAMNEMSNADVSFTNTNLGLYTEKINQDYNNGSDNYRYSQLASFGQNGFTADFSQPVTNVSMDFALNSYYARTGEENNWATLIYESPYAAGLIAQTPTTINATYKDASGQIVVSSSVSTAFSPDLVHGGQLNNPDFSLDASAPFSSIDISWDSGTVSRIEHYGHYEQWGAVERSYNNLLTANNFTYTQAVAVPEPETYAMMMAGLGMLGFTARRRKTNQA